MITRHHILDGLLQREGKEPHERYLDTHVNQLLADGMLLAVPEESSMREALETMRQAKGRVILLPHSFYLEDGKRARKDVTEGYDSLSTPRRVQAAMRAHLKKGGAPSWFVERAATQQPMTTSVMKEMTLTPTGLYPYMMAEPLPLPTRGIASPRARERAKEERPVIGVTYTTLGHERAHVMIPWYVLVEGAVTVARRRLGQGRLLHGDIIKQSKSVHLKGWHQSSTSNKRYDVRMNTVAFGNDNEALNDWLTTQGMPFASCSCDDFQYNSVKNRWQTTSYKLCKHQAALSYWMTAMGRTGFEGRWHNTPFLIPLTTSGKSRFTVALRLRRQLQTRTLIDDGNGNAVALNFATQSAFYGAENIMRMEAFGEPLFSPGVLNAGELYTLAQEEKKLLRDPIYART
jgi:hypothetical protein